MSCHNSIQQDFKNSKFYRSLLHDDQVLYNKNTEFTKRFSFIKTKGINAFFLHSAFAVIAFVVFSGILLLSSYVIKRYMMVQEAISRFMACQQSSREIMEYSNYLTEQARLFVTSQKPKYFETYVKESSNLQTQRSALERVRLREIDNELSYEELRELSISTLFNEGYLIYRDRINENLQLNADQLGNTLRKLRLCLFLLMLLTILSFASLVVLVLKPLKKFQNAIKKEEKLGIIGFSFHGLPINHIF